MALIVPYLLQQEWVPHLQSAYREVVDTTSVLEHFSVAPNSHRNYPAIPWVGRERERETTLEGLHRCLLMDIIVLPVLW